MNVELVVSGLEQGHDVGIEGADVVDEVGVVLVREGLEPLLYLQVVPVRVLLDVCCVAVLEQLQHLKSQLVEQLTLMASVYRVLKPSHHYLVHLLSDKRLVRPALLALRPKPVQELTLLLQLQSCILYVPLDLLRPAELLELLL